MAKLVECVPNFSEGRDRNVIKQITDAIESVEGAELKDVDPGADTNRVVVTFVGSPEAAKEAAFRAIARAAEVIDMSKHSGAHPRMGATDVCPFVPVSDVTMEDCARLARELGQRVGDQLGIPVYLYENAATRPERRSLANIRRGEYEGLAEKLADPQWRPDFGPTTFNARAGATVIGAREFLIAYNIDLNSRCKDHATDIAFELREKGRSARRGETRPFYYRGEVLKHSEGRFLCGSCDLQAKTAAELFAHTKGAHEYDLAELCRLHDQDPGNLIGASALKPGLFHHCRAIGWEVPQYDRVQISINLTDYRVTPPHVVLDKARELAAERGLVVTGSEIVGLVPLPAMVEAGRHYLRKQGRSTGIPLDDVLATAVQSMGLADVQAFDIREKVLGYPKADPGALVQKKTDDLVHEVSRESPAPGGGSVAALAGALGAALASMVANLTAGKAKDELGQFRQVAEEAQALKDGLLEAVDADANAFSGYMSAMRLPKGTVEERAARKAAMDRELEAVIGVPLETARRSLRAMEAALLVGRTGNASSVSDAGVGALAAFTGVMGGILNVLINLGGLEDAAYVDQMRATVADLEKRARQLLEETLAIVRARMPLPAR
ncbi:MAG: glutamate formimidoyltransferase [Deltaproteobacteria bacterium]|nr:glutamate formimidoyltransferase [Deltaproteobacteria bacterium]